jgi:hypothetical protein
VAKVMVSLPDGLLARLDREARRRGTSRSALLQEAARTALGGFDPDAFDGALARSRARFSRTDSFESGELVRADREARDANDRRPL